MIELGRTKDTILFLCTVGQALSAVVVVALAVWATFFSPLPEVLHTQLRSDISEAKGHIEELRKEKNDLESENESLISHRDNLDQAIASLRSEKNLLTKNIMDLQAQRTQYANAAIGITTSKMAVIADHQLSLYEYFVTVGVKYKVHRNWLDACRELETLRPEYNALEYQDKYGDSNHLAVRFRELESVAIRIPKIWFGFPTEPILEPTDGSTYISSQSARLLNLISEPNCRKIHDDLINFFFDYTVMERGVVSQTGSTFIAILKDADFFDDLLIGERKKLFDKLDMFLDQNQNYGTRKINLTFESEPTATEIPVEAMKIQENLREFREKFEAFMSSFKGGEN